MDPMVFDTLISQSGGLALAVSGVERTASSGSIIEEEIGNDGLSTSGLG
jgi:hypothetical protein